MEPLSIAALVAMVAGAAYQRQASIEAQDRQQQAIINGLNAQEELQKKAEKVALDKAKEFDPNERIKNQAQLEEQISSELIAPVSESQKIRSENAGVQGNVSDDYNTAKAKADLNTLKTAESMARLLGKTTSSNRLRMNEGIGLMDAGQSIDQLNSFSRGQQGADNIAIQRAGLTDPNKVFAGQLLQSIGSAALMYRPTPGTGGVATGTGGNTWGSLNPNGSSSFGSIDTSKYGGIGLKY